MLRAGGLAVRPAAGTHPPRDGSRHAGGPGPDQPDIAARLCLSVRTVEVHIDHILTKLGFRARTRLAAWAHEEGPLAGQGNT